MKKIGALFLLLGLGLILFFFFSKGPRKEVASLDENLEEKTSFVVIIPSYNNEKWCVKNLTSVLEQDYQNFRVIYIDDASTDATFEKVSALLSLSKEWQKRTQLIRNEVNQGAMANLYHAIHSCLEREVVVILDGDDWFAHYGVLSRLNRAYVNPETWLTYGSYADYPGLKRGECSKRVAESVVKEASFRKAPWTTSHLRTFYAGLFKRIKLQDLVEGGKFYDATYDMAIMYPLLEMARDHAQFIKDILCVYNRATPLNDDKIRFARQQFLKNRIQNLPSYAPLATLKEDAVEERADLVVFSYDRPLQLYAFLESTFKHMQGLGKVGVIFRSSSQDFLEQYQVVQKAFPEVVFIDQGESPQENFKELTLQMAFQTFSSDYLLFAVDDIIVKENVDLKACVSALKETGAHGFYLKLGRHTDYCYMLDTPQGIPSSIQLKNKVYAWRFAEGIADWKYPHTLDLTLYNKKEIYPILSKLTFHNPNSLESMWASKAAVPDFEKMGLYFESSKSVNIPLNLVNISSNRHANLYSAKELLAKFKAGLKIDITPFAGLKNRAAHLEKEVVFVEREHE